MAASSITRRLRLTDSIGLTGLGMIVVLICAAVVVVGTTLGLVIGLGRHYGRISCRTFSAQTGRPTKFVIYNTFDTGDCLTPSGKGTWIPTKNLREFGNGGR